MPDPLSSLYRFYEHDRAILNQDADADSWVVSCGKFEEGYRLYRIMFKSIRRPELNIDEERIIPVNISKAQSSLQEFISSIYKVLQTVVYPLEYKRACYKLLMEDPWIEEFMKNYNLTVSTLQTYSLGL